jgi:signal transduction histidine kinase
MESRKLQKRILYAMMLVNLFVIMYYVIVCTVSKSVICEMNMAYAFLSNSGRIPHDTFTLCRDLLIYYGALCALILAKEDIYDENILNRVLICAGELALSVIVVRTLNFYYSGIALLVLADLLYYENKKVPRVLFIVLQVLELVIGNDEILSYFDNNIQFSSYLSGFDPMVRSWIIVAESLMTFTNILLFLLFVLTMIIRQKAENSRILRLNMALSGKNAELHEANVKLQEYSETIKRMTEIEERNRLAREIHDTLGHALTGIVVNADAGKILFDAAPEEAKARFDVIGQTARQGLEDVRRSIRALRPDALESRDLESALEKMIENFRETTGADIRYEQEAGKLLLAQDEEVTVYRIVQEGMTNAIRHGKATQINLIIDRKDRNLRVRIFDNGVGMQGKKTGFGLNYMEERVELLKGSLRYGNREDGSRGFFLEAEIPVRGVNPEAEMSVRDISPETEMSESNVSL